MSEWTKGRDVEVVADANHRPHQLGLFQSLDKEVDGKRWRSVDLVNNQTVGLAPGHRFHLGRSKSGHTNEIFYFFSKMTVFLYHAKGHLKVTLQFWKRYAKEALLKSASTA